MSEANKQSESGSGSSHCYASLRHPIQPLAKDEHGTIRFKENAIVRYLLDAGQFDMNHLAVTPFSQEDREQFAQLIGYSLSGYSELSYVRDDSYEAAEKMAEGVDERDARIESLTEKLDSVRNGLREIVPKVFRIHPDDLEA